MLIENSSRIDNVQLELNTVDIYFWFRRFSIKASKKGCIFFNKKPTINNLEIKKYYFKNLKNLIPKILNNLSFFHPTLIGNKPWVFFWLLNSLDIIYFHLKNNLCIKNSSQIYLFLSKINLSKIFKNSIASLFLVYSTTLYSTLKFNGHYQIIKSPLVKSIYYFIRSLFEGTLSPRNSEISDCDGRNLFCIFSITSLFGILTRDLENLCIKQSRHLSITSEGFSTKNFSGAHGALTYCWLGSLSFLDIKDKKIKISFNIKKWLITRQNFFVFGFSGKISKLPDSCYNFWVGASLVMMNVNLNEKLENSFMFCNDRISESFSDRSGKITDFYHICYSVCGFAILNFLTSCNNNLTEKKISIKTDLFFWNLAKINPLFSLREAIVINFISFNR